MRKASKKEVEEQEYAILKNEEEAKFIEPQKKKTI